MASKRLSFGDLVHLVGMSLSRHTNDALWIEVEAFVSGFNSTIGITALREGSGDPERTTLVYIPDWKDGDGKFRLSIPVLGRNEFLKHLEASCGLSREACAIALSAVECRLRELAPIHGTEVSVEKVGTFTNITVKPEHFLIEVHRTHNNKPRAG